MSLLINFSDPRLHQTAQQIFEAHFKHDPKLRQEMDERRQRLMFDDILYNMSFLFTAVHFNDVQIFEKYSLWIYELLCNLMKDLNRDRIMVQMTDHYRFMSRSLKDDTSDILSPHEVDTACEFLKQAILVTERAVTEIPLSSAFLEGPFSEIRKEYLDALMRGKTYAAYHVIDKIKEEGASLPVIYEEILTKTMHEVGELWHQSILTVDKEHYATSVTQSVMSRFFDEIISQPRKPLTLLSCSVGSELHEMGIRMLSDLFEYHGWDTYYLGASVPDSAILNAIHEQQPDLVALSVTMPPYLPVCEQLVKKIRSQFPKMKIAIGGQAFLTTLALWEKWPIDHYTSSASDLIRWASSTFEQNQIL